MVVSSPPQMASCAARVLLRRVWLPDAARPSPAAPLALACSSARRLRKVCSFVRASLPMSSLLDITYPPVHWLIPDRGATSLASVLYPAPPLNRCRISRLSLPQCDRAGAETFPANWGRYGACASSA